MAFPSNPTRSTTARKPAPDVGAILLKAKNVGVDPVHLDALKRAAKGGKVERDELSAALDAMEEHGTDPGEIDLVRRLCTKLPKRPAHVEAPPASPIPRGFVEPCDSEEGVAVMVASRAGGRLRHVAESGEWLIFLAPGGWMPVSTAVVEETLTDCARSNVGHIEKKTGFQPRPSSSGRRSVGRNIAGLLTGRVEVASRSADWDAAPNMIMLPDGTLLDLFTGARRPSNIGDLVRRRVPADPATDTEFDQSRFRAVLKHAVPDPTERSYLQRRLGAALADREGLDDLLWLYGPPGSAKGTLAAVLKRAFADYGQGVPINQLIRGTNRSGHSAWAARLAGCRLMFADDVPVGSYLDDSTVNMLLGSEVTAQFMRQGYFDFRLNAPIFATSNAPPQTSGTNVRRLKVIKSGARVASPDPAVRASMSSPAEVAACLRWLIDGARLWMETGCPVPATVTERAEEAAEDSPVAVFTETFAPGRHQTTEVYRRWIEFKRGLGDQPGSQKLMIGQLRAGGWTAKKTNGIRYLIAPWTAAGSGRVTSTIDPTYARAYMRDNKKRDPTCPYPADEFPPGALGGGDQETAGPPDQPVENPDSRKAAATDRKGPAPPDRSVAFLRPAPTPPAEPPANGNGAASVETESGDQGPAPTDRIDGILAAAERLLGASDLKTAARQHVREQAGKDRCRLCGAPPPLELTGPAALALCATCAANHHEMTATPPADLSARVDQHVGGKSLDELWTGALETAEKLLQDDPELRRLALEDPDLRRFVH